MQVPVLKVTACSSSPTEPTETSFSGILLWRAYSVKQYIQHMYPATAQAFNFHLNGGIITCSSCTVTAANHILNTQLC